MDLAKTFKVIVDTNYNVAAIGELFVNDLDWYDADTPEVAIVKAVVVSVFGEEIEDE